MNVYSFEINDKEYKVRFTIESLMKLEEWTGAGVSALANEDKFGVSTVVNLLRAGLYWKDKGITQQRAAGIYSAYCEDGQSRKELFNELVGAYSKSIQSYLPTDEEDESDEEGKND